MEEGATKLETDSFEHLAAFGCLVRPRLIGRVFESGSEQIIDACSSSLLVLYNIYHVLNKVQSAAVTVELMSYVVGRAGNHGVHVNSEAELAAGRRGRGLHLAPKTQQLRQRAAERAQHFSSERVQIVSLSSVFPPSSLCLITLIFSSIFPSLKI